MVKIEQVPANRYLYYLTPKGFAEKSRLTAKYLLRSFLFYRQAGDSCLRLLINCQAQNQHNVVLCGISDLAEVALLQATRADVNVDSRYL